MLCVTIVSASFLCLCRVIQQLLRALQQLANILPTASTQTALPAAASAASVLSASAVSAASPATAPAAAAAAARLAVFLPLPELLSLTHESLNLAQSQHPQGFAQDPESQTVNWVTGLALALTQGIIKSLPRYQLTLTSDEYDKGQLHSIGKMYRETMTALLRLSLARSSTKEKEDAAVLSMHGLLLQLLQAVNQQPKMLTSKG